MLEWWHILLIVIGSVLLLLILSIVLYKQFFKRFWDIVLSGLAIVILSPFLIVLTIVGAIAMRGNPYFSQQRLGKRNKKTDLEKKFVLLKFRTMSNAKDKNGNLLSDEKRLNKYGRFLRSTSLDELPELFNIFIGTMSIVGPRPLGPVYLPYYTVKERHRHDILPGLTGWAQVNGRNSISWDSKFRFDVEYVNKMSFFFDIKILLLTVRKVFKREGIGQGEEVPESLHIVRKEWLDENGQMKAQYQEE